LKTEELKSSFAAVARWICDLTTTREEPLATILSGRRFDTSEERLAGDFEAGTATADLASNCWPGIRDVHFKILEQRIKNHCRRNGPEINF